MSPRAVRRAKSGRSRKSLLAAPHPSYVYLLADDLTGACDAAAAFLQAGHSVRVWFGSHALHATPESVQAFNTNSRSLAPEKADLAVSRAINYGITDGVVPKQRTLNSDLCLMAQIETGDAMRRLEELASVDDVDLFIGPADLAASLGFPGQTSHPDVQTAAADLVKAARSHNKAVATACASEDFPFWISLDIDLLFCANDIACLKKAAGDIPGEARETLESRVTSV